MSDHPAAGASAVRLLDTTFDSVSDPLAALPADHARRFVFARLQPILAASDGDATDEQLDALLGELADAAGRVIGAGTNAIEVFEHFGRLVYAAVTAAHEQVCPHCRANGGVDHLH